jgi:hypothetical protein
VVSVPLSVQGVVDLLVELLMALTARLVHGGDLVSDLAHGLSGPGVLWAAAAVLLVVLVAGAWIAFWDD